MLLDVLARQARDRADHAFLLHEGRQVTFREFDRLANRAANRLVGMGVVPGDRVTLGLGNSIEYVATAFGILRAGGVLHPINPALGRGETEFILAHAAPRVVVRAETVGDLGLDDGDDTGPSRQPSPGDPSLLLYTSGTTGAPKGVLFTHGTSGSAGERFVEALHIGADDVILAVTPLFHGNAWGAVQTALYAGGTVVFPTTFSASGFWPLVHESGTTVLYTLGTILAMLLSRPASVAERTHRMRVILGLGSAPVRTQVIERFGVRDVVECFGSTDAGVVTISPLGETPRPGSCGRPLPGVELRVLDDAGVLQPPRTIGEIAVRSPSRMTCYFKDPEATAQAVRDDWFLTGDLGWLDEDGWLYFTDRKRDVIRRGGENVSSVLVEKTLREHPAVAEVAVIGVPDPVLGQELKAYVVASGPVTAAELQAFAAERLARFQVPRLWEFRDALPKTPTQRVEKYKLREEHASGKPLLG